MKTPSDKNLLSDYLQLHLIVLILGFTAILGRLITLNAQQIVFYRMFIAAVSLGLFLLFIRKRDLKAPLKRILLFLGTGFIVAAHWTLFFEAIKVSNVSVTLGCLASTTLFASFLEPFILKRKILWPEVLIGLVIIGGLYMIFQFETHFIDGIILATLSAFLAGLFTVLNKKLVTGNNANVISFYEMAGGFAGIAAFMFISGAPAIDPFAVSLSDWIYLLILGIICTAFAFVVAVKVMKELSAFTVVLSINLEPVYGILLAYLFFGESEKMTAGFYIGTAVILLAVASHSYIKKKFIKERPVMPQR